MSIKHRVAAASLLAAAATAGAVLAPTSAVAATPSTPSAATKAACDKTAWEAKVQGRPTFEAGSPSGEYLWHDSDGFHLRVTHKSHEKVLYSGQISASAAMAIDPVKLEGKDFVTLSADKKVLTFAFQNYGYIDGVNFHTNCATALKVRFVHANGKTMSNERVYLGAKSAHPAQVPFTVHRVKAV